MTRVTVLVPTYNRPEMLREALHSLLAQTKTDWRAIVSDNGGSSGSDAVVCGMDPRISYLWFPVPKTQGWAGTANFNRLFRMWEDGYACMLCDDDTLPPNSLEVRSAWLDAHPDIDAVSCDMTMGGAIRSRDPADWPESFDDWGDNTNSCSWMFRTRPPEMDERFGSAVDLLWQYQMRETGMRLGHIARPLYGYGLHPAQASNPALKAETPEKNAAENEAIRQEARRWAAAR